jgi:hypothetical protein
VKRRRRRRRRRRRSKASWQERLSSLFFKNYQTLCSAYKV